MKGSRTVLRGVRGSDAPRLPDLTTYVYDIQRKSRKNYRGSNSSFFLDLIEDKVANENGTLNL